jgi:hypothetical protein
MDTTVDCCMHNETYCVRVHAADQHPRRRKKLQSERELADGLASDKIVGTG